VDSIGATLDFLLMAKQAAARHILAKALGGATHPPRVINTNRTPLSYPSAIAGLRAADDLDERLPARPEPYLI
jgi:hypothetical protein